MTDELDPDELVMFQGDLVRRSFRDRKRAQAREAIAQMRAMNAAARPAEQVARERAAAQEEQSHGAA